MAIDNPLTVYRLDDLRARRSMKWQTYEPDVLPLWVAEMDTPLAPPIRDALVRAVEGGDTGYAYQGGLAEAWAKFSADRFGWAPDPASASLVPDVMRGIVEVLKVVTEPGDAVVVNTPAYPPFFAFLSQAGRRVVESPLAPDERRGYVLDFARLERDFAAGARAYLVCNPHNPTGTILTRAELVQIATLAERYDVRVLVDEIHSPLTYPGVRHVPFLSLADEAPAAARGFAFVSASKAWNLPGLKTALSVAGPAAQVDHARVPNEVRLGAGLFGVIAAEVALRDGVPWLDALCAGLDANRRLLTALLAEHLPGVRYREPDGTYLAWLDCRGLGLGDDPAETFLRRGRVAVNSGPTFGAPGHGFVRLNLATAPELLTEGVRRMAAAVG
ncbi:MAG TPA: MalY/PatB family protein [Micromonosporaceae bacterium]